MSASMCTHTDIERQTQPHQLPYAIKKQEDLLYFTHPQGVNNSLEARKGGGSWGRWRGWRWAVRLWAVHLRISACHCAQRSWGRFMASLAACHKTCQGVSRPEIGYYVPALFFSNLFLPFWDFYCSSYWLLIYYLFILCHELCISLKRSIKIKFIMRLN